jgi:hypothetical protein
MASQDLELAAHMARDFGLDQLEIRTAWDVRVDNMSPAELERVKPRPPAPATTFDDFKRYLEAQGRDVKLMDTYELGQFCVQGVKDGRFIISYDLDDVRAMLHRRADEIGDARLPEPHFAD